MNFTPSGYLRRKQEEFAKLSGTHLSVTTVKTLFQTHRRLPIRSDSQYIKDLESIGQGALAKGFWCVGGRAQTVLLKKSICHQHGMAHTQPNDVRFPLRRPTTLNPFRFEHDLPGQHMQLQHVQGCSWALWVHLQSSKLEEYGSGPPLYQLRHKIQHIKCQPRPNAPGLL